MKHIFWWHPPPSPLPDPLHYLQSLSISQYAGKMYVPPPLLSRIKPQSVPVFQLCSVSAQNNNQYINAELSDTLEAITRQFLKSNFFFLSCNKKFCLEIESFLSISNRRKVWKSEHFLKQHRGYISIKRIRQWSSFKSEVLCQERSSARKSWGIKLIVKAQNAKK